MNTQAEWSRRQFVQYLGAGAVVATLPRLVPNCLVAATVPGDAVDQPSGFLDRIEFKTLANSSADTVALPEGFTYEVLVKQGDVINGRGDRFGDNNDYLALIQTTANEGWMWVNHEAVMLGIVSGYWGRQLKEEHARVILENMGGSCLRMKKTERGWRPILPHGDNFRVNGLNTRFFLTGPGARSRWMQGKMSVTGTVANCGGGISPWGTFFTAEENYQDIWGDPEVGAAISPVAQYYDRSAHDYGYMCEIDPERKQFYKHTALGRFSHENIAFTTAKDGRLVAYMGDDRKDQCIYKFVSEGKMDPGAGHRNRRLLTKGTLYVANTRDGEWSPLDPERQPSLRKAGFDLARVCVHTRSAAKLCYGTPQARPEDVEVHPLTGDVYVSLTSYLPPPESWEDTIKEGRAPMGALARIREAGGDAGAEKFEFEIFVMGGTESGLAWPDNLAWTDENHLLATTDYSVKPFAAPESAQGHFGHNFLAVVPTVGDRAGQVFRFAAAPAGAEFCSPTLSPDREELWINVQHPGKGSKGPANLLSHWPDGGDALPRSACVAIFPQN